MGRSIRRLARLLVLATAWLPVAHAAAQAEPASAGARAAASAAGETVRERARAHFTLAVEHYRARRYRDAIHEFRLSLAYVPSAEIWFNIARAHEQLGERALAIEHYRLYLRDRVDAPDAQEVQRRIADLERAQSEHRAETARRELGGGLAIDAPDPGAEVRLDRKPLGVAPLQRVVQLVPGRHRIESERTGHVPFRAEVDVYPGSLSAAYVQSRPLARAGAEQPDRLLTWIAAGAGAGALLAGVGLTLLANERRGDGERGAARDAQLAADLAVGAGVALAVSAVLLYFVEGRSESPAALR